MLELPTPPKRPPFVCLTWMDATAVAGWQEANSLPISKEDMYCFTAGYLIKSTPLMLIITSTLTIADDEWMWNAELNIPRKSVVWMKKIRLPRKYRDSPKKR